MAAERHAARQQPALDGRGAAATALAARREHLEQAEAVLRLAEQRMKSARDAATTAGRIRADLARPAPARFMSRANEARARLAETEALIARAQQAADLARAEAPRHANETGVEPDGIATAAAELRAAWNDTRPDAIDDDVAAVGDQPAAHANLARARVRLTSLRAEC